MPSTRARMLPLALLLAACGHTSAPTSEPPGPVAAEPASPAVPDPPATSETTEDPAAAAPATDTPIQTGERTAAQKVTFDDDADPEPTTQIQGAPKRPPIPRFRLFGTRDGDGPN